MNKNMVIVFFLVVLAAAGYYCYEQGYFNSEIAQVEQALVDICDPAQEDCSAIEEDLAV
ncbi:MAG: hypothetical protein Q8Q60_01370 [Candidatus Chromulinivorax sp.]|nr:hypothetical protein [Candidatus Chromulinivorax sp.]